MCGVPPTPEVPYDTPLACFFEYVMRSCKVFAGNEGCATMMIVASPIIPTGARSVMTSIGKFAKTCGLMTSVPSNPSRSVYPSGAAAAACCVPMFPDAPALFSIMIGCPRRFPNASATSLPLVSVTPPGANGTIKRMGFSGKSACAAAEMTSDTIVAASLFMANPPPTRLCLVTKPQRK